jgi:hypothetical protein
MKKRKFLKVNKDKMDFVSEIYRLNSELDSKQKHIRRLLKERDDARAYSTTSEETHFEIYMICSSYESGFGHGLANDGLDLGKTPHSEKHLGMAYQIGYDAGQRRYKETLGD